MIIYKVAEQAYRNEETGEYTGFGIGAYAADGREIAFVPDVFLQREPADALVRLCNTLGLAPVHLMDVIEDAI